MSTKPYLKRGIDLVNIARTLFGFDKKPEPVEEKPKPEPEPKRKPDPRLRRTSKFVRPVKSKPEPEEVEPDAE